MSTALALPESNGIAAPPASTPLDAKTLEMVVVGGDLSKLSPAQRLQWYQARCDAAGLDARTQPFLYVTLSGKLTLYATKAATDQLIASRRLRVEIVSRGAFPETGLYEVQARVTFPDGRSVDDVGALSIQGLKGEALANAVMKAVTKAKRRTVLSACGLGMLDETEVITIPGAVAVDPDAGASVATTYPALPVANNNSGHGRGSYASPEATDEYQAARNRFLDAANGRFVDRWLQPDGSIVEGIREPLRSHQIDGHLLKWALAEGLLDPAIVPEQAKPAQVPKYLAILFARNREAIKLEMNRYAKEKAADEARRWRRANPEARPECIGFEELMEAEADDIIDAELVEPEPADEPPFEPGSNG